MLSKLVSKSYCLSINYRGSLPTDKLINYQPISGLGVISKLMVFHLNDHVNSNGLNVNQSSYKLSHSTETTLLSIKNEVHVSLVILLEVKLLSLFSLTNLQHLTPLMIVLSLTEFLVWGVLSLTKFLIWWWWRGSRLVHVLPLWLFSVHQDWLYFIWCQKAVVWCAPELGPGTNPILLIYYSPKQCYGKSSWHKFPLVCCWHEVVLSSYTQESYPDLWSAEKLPRWHQKVAFCKQAQT